MKSDDAGKLLLRITVGGLMLFHGVSKLVQGVEGVKGLLGANGLPGFLAYGLYAAEIIAPALIILGWWTRIAALVVAFDMLMAILLVFKQQLFTIKEMGGGWTIELEAFFLLSSLVLFFTGGGKYSISKKQSAWD
ncbi:MAG: DoxX family protein [Ignavibacteria bacterium]